MQEKFTSICLRTFSVLKLNSSLLSFAPCFSAEACGLLMDCLLEACRLQIGKSLFIYDREVQGSIGKTSVFSKLQKAFCMFQTHNALFTVSVPMFLEIKSLGNSIKLSCI